MPQTFPLPVVLLGYRHIHLLDVVQFWWGCQRLGHPFRFSFKLGFVEERKERSVKVLVKSGILWILLAGQVVGARSKLFNFLFGCWISRMEFVIRSSSIAKISRIKLILFFGLLIMERLISHIGLILLAADRWFVELVVSKNGPVILI